MSTDKRKGSKHDEPKSIGDIVTDLNRGGQGDNSMEVFDFSERLPRHIIERINEEFAVEADALQRAGQYGYMARGMVNATMPYKNPKADVFKRVSGDYTLRIVGGDEGIPFGIYPRLLMLWLTTEVVQKGSPREVQLGENLAVFMRDALGLSSVGGGKRGTSTMVADQMKRLFGSMVSMKYAPKTGSRRPYALNNIMIADKVRMEDENGDFLWVPQSTEQKGWKSMVQLSQPFFDELREGPVVVDIRKYRSLRTSPLAMDLYTWLTFRMSYLSQPTTVSWERLMLQFGSSYPTDPQGVRNFRKNFREALTMVHEQYNTARFETNVHGLVLYRSPTDVPKRIMVAQKALDFGEPK